MIIQNLILCSLVTFGYCSKSVNSLDHNSNVKNQAVETLNGSSNSNYLYGFYTCGLSDAVLNLNDSIDVYLYESSEIAFNDYADNIYVYVNNGHNMSSSTFYMSYDYYGSGQGTLQIACSNFADYEIDLEIQNQYYLDDYLDGYQVDDLRNIVLWFTQPIALTNSQRDLFYSVFTKGSNDYTTSYSGWYTFNERSTNGGTQANIFLYGYLTVDNLMYESIMVNSGNNGSIDAYTYDGATVTADDIMFGGGTWRTSRQVFIDSVIPNYYYQQLQRRGTFSYVYQPVDYDFGDLFFSLVDTPIYALSSLFSFELFGIQFFTAFLGVCTLLLICLCIRKFI